MRVLVAFDKFKGCLSAEDACKIAAAAISTKHPDWDIDHCPFADGGDGFARVLTDAVAGEMSGVVVSGPRGQAVEAHYGIVDRKQIPPAARALVDEQHYLESEGKVAVIEMAAASGLALLTAGDRDPFQATTFGAGQLIHEAARRGVASIVLGVGGSATHDLGLGALSALGIRFLGIDNRDVGTPVPSKWADIVSLAGSLVDSLPPIKIACDVKNPLLGPDGAAAVYGAQKGLRHEDQRILEDESERIATLLCRHWDRPSTLLDRAGAGAAGGLSFGLMAATDAKLIDGADFVSRWLDLPRRLALADIIITGEGCFDLSSMKGKGPGALLAHALALNKNIHVFAGRVASSIVPTFPIHVITPPDTSEQVAFKTAAINLASAVAKVF